MNLQFPFLLAILVFCNISVIFPAAMEPGKCENTSSETQSVEAETSMSVAGKPTIPEDEFGRGCVDSAYQPRVWRDMGKLFQQETMSDVMLMAEGHSIPCHKFLLAAASEYFYKKLTAATDVLNHNLFEIEGISFQTLRIVVSYMYTGNINITLENAGDVVSACKMLKLNSASEKCEVYLIEKISPANCIAFYKIATAHDVQQLKEKAREVMENDFETVVSGPEFLEMSANEVKEYIQSEGLRIRNEDPVYDAVMSWINYKADERAPSFSLLLKNIRLQFCSERLLKFILPKEPLMETLENQKILVSALKHQATGSLCWDKVQSECMECNILPRNGYQRISRMTIIGGIADPGQAKRRECWNLGEKGWNILEKCPLPGEMYLYSACLVNDVILVSGGRIDGKAVSQCWLLSTSTCQWRPLPDLNTARAKHASVCVAPEGDVCVIAGQVTDGTVIPAVECLKGKKNQWEIMPNIPKAVMHPMAVAYRLHIYVFGGTDMKGTTSSLSGCVFRPARKSWQVLPNMPTACTLGSVVVFKDMFFLVGGIERSCMSFDPVLNVWTRLSQCKHQHADAPAVVWNDRILICGGRSGKARRDDGTPAGSTVIEEYDPDTDTWTVSDIELPQKLSSHFVFVTEAV